MHATSAAEDAGDLRLESLLGSIVVAAKLDLAGRKARGSYGETDGNPGLLSLKAGVDVTFTGPVDLSHGDYGGDLDVQAGRDIVVRADLALDSAPLSLEGNGGWLSLTAGRDIVIDVPEDGSDQTLVSSNGGHGLAMYRHWDAGGGGYSRIEALGDVRIAEGTAIEANSPFTYGGDGVPDGGYFKARIGGDFLLDGTIHLDGSGPSSGGGTAKIYTGGDIAIGANALLSARGDHSGEVRFDNSGGASRKRIAVRGGIDVRARRSRYDGETSYGYGGEIDIYSGDITLSGTLLAGDGGGGSEVRGNACSITLENSALIDQRSARGQYAGGTNDFSAEESFVAQAGSQILGLPSMTTTISYRRSSPPVLEGTIDPPPTLQPHDWTWASCPICGDGRRETGESCDDGNTSSGDGCTADCQDEGCLSQSPSYPAVPLCDDGDGCTLDTCNSTTHSCEHRSNCDDGVACSIDACVGGACTHTADDGACDDGNVCTSDLCNVTRDCVNALTHYVACEDGDLCTSTGRCNYYYYRSTCIASDVRAASAGRLRITPTGAAGGDAWMAIVKIPAAMATQPLTTTGLRVRLYRDSGSFVFDATIAAENFTGPHPGVYRFVDRDGKVPGARGIVDVLRRPGRDDTVVLRIKGRGADFARIYDAPLLGLSLLSGEDPTIDECTTARPLACKRTERRVLCGT
ncbi:MAG: hypothetical protein HY899_04945 [Deltaproteobacteria bacterium]|nr:hypothetical protein [Deltaproteobacteria bacterium]